jgi:hypothetical protein
VKWTLPADWRRSRRHRAIKRVIVSLQPVNTKLVPLTHRVRVNGRRGSLTRSAGAGRGPYVVTVAGETAHGLRGALAAAVMLNHQLGRPSRSLVAYTA